MPVFSDDSSRLSPFLSRNNAVIACLESDSIWRPASISSILLRNGSVRRINNRGGGLNQRGLHFRWNIPFREDQMGLRDTVAKFLNRAGQENITQENPTTCVSELSALKTSCERPQLSNQDILARHEQKFKEIFGTNADDDPLTVAIPLQAGATSDQLELKLPVEFGNHLLVSMNPGTVYEYLQSVDRPTFERECAEGFHFNRDRMEQEPGGIVVRLVTFGSSNSHPSKGDEVYLAPYERWDTPPAGQQPSDYCFEPQWKENPTQQLKEEVFKVLNQLNEGLSGEFVPMGGLWSSSGPNGASGLRGRGLIYLTGEADLDRASLELEILSRLGK